MSVWRRTSTRICPDWAFAGSRNECACEVPLEPCEEDALDLPLDGRRRLLRTATRQLE